MNKSVDRFGFTPVEREKMLEIITAMNAVGIAAAYSDLAAALTSTALAFNEYANLSAEIEAMYHRMSIVRALVLALTIGALFVLARALMQ